MPETDFIARELHDLNFPCGYCRAPFKDHSLDSLKICFQRLTAARSTLAQKVLEHVEQAVRSTYEPESKSAEVGRNIAHALRELFQREGVEVR